jgi:4-hydroxybenzoyl-CoA reductase subunit beta
MRAFSLQQPQSLAEAAALLAAEPPARLLAGGTDLVPNLRRGIDSPARLVDLSRVAGLDELHSADSGATIGAGVRLARLIADAGIKRRYRAVAEAAEAVAAPGHRSAATVGGNLCLDTRCVFYNQDAWWRAANDHCLKRGGTTCHVAPQGNRCHAAFSGDLAPALLALGAEVDVASSRGTRRLPLADLYRDDGAAHLALQRDELLVRVHLPAPGPGVCGYRKARVRGAIDFPLAGVAMVLALRDGALAHLAVALTGTNARPFVLDGTQALIGRPVDETAAATLGRLVSKQVSPMRTTVTPSNHRRLAAAAQAQRLLRELAAAGNAQ